MLFKFFSLLLRGGFRGLVLFDVASRSRGSPLEVFVGSGGSLLEVVFSGVALSTPAPRSHLASELNEKKKEPCPGMCLTSLGSLALEETAGSLTVHGHGRSVCVRPAFVRSVSAQFSTPGMARPSHRGGRPCSHSRCDLVQGISEPLFAGRLFAGTQKIFKASAGMSPCVHPPCVRRKPSLTWR